MPLDVDNFSKGEVYPSGNVNASGGFFVCSSVPGKETDERFVLAALYSEISVISGFGFPPNPTSKEITKMAFRRNSDWSLNKGTNDIVYPFLDGTTKRFRKLNGQVYEITEGTVPCKTITMLPTDEISVEQFDELKRWSDENYQAEDRYDVHHSRGQVPLELVENTIEASSGFLLDEEKAECFRTLENALLILDALKLTDTQRRRFKMAVNGLTTREIAAVEECSQPCIVESLAAVEKKIKKYFLKHPIKTLKK